MKVAFDENVPVALVRVFKTFASERQLRFLTKGLTIESSADYTPRPGDPDYEKNNDVPWVKRFAAAGGKVIVSGDVDMKTVPHERLALVEAGMVVIFFERQWSQWPFFRKCALLLHWWPLIADKVKRARKGSFWRVPCNFSLEGKLERLSNTDEKKLKIQRQLAKKGKPKPAKKTEIPKDLVVDLVPKPAPRAKRSNPDQHELRFDEPQHEAAKSEALKETPEGSTEG